MMTRDIDVTQRQARVEWAYIARGIGIILVVFGHTWRGVFSAGLMENTALYEAIDRMVYAFHMPLFFFLAGLFYPKLLLHGTYFGIIKSRIIKLIYPLLLWTYIFILLKVVVGSYANQALTLSEVFAFPLPGRWHYWFLWALFLTHISGLVIKPFLQARLPSTHQMIWCTVLVASLILYFTPLACKASPWLHGMVKFLPYFLAGVCFMRFDFSKPSRASLLGAGVLFLLAEYAFVSFPFAIPFDIPLANEFTNAFGMAVAFIGILFVIMLSQYTERYLEKSQILRLIKYLGVISMPIFLAHTIFSASARIMLTRLHYSDAASHVAAGVLVGIAGPMVLYILAQKFGFKKYLGF